MFSPAPSKVIIPVILFCLLLPVAKSGEQQTNAGKAVLSSFYIVRTSFSDNGPSTYHYILDVLPAEGGTLIRIVRIAGLDPPCRHVVTVKAVEKTLLKITPAKLVAKNNPCMLSVDRIRRSIRSNPTNIFESVRFGIVANCGSEKRVIDLPFFQTVDFKYLDKHEPKVAALWDLYSQVEQTTFGKTPIFYDISEQRDAELQKFGQSRISDILSGRYDEGFFCGWDAGKSASCGFQPFQFLLRNYRPNAKVPEQTSTLWDAEKFHFIKYVPPTYPLLAQRARIQCKVNLELVADPLTGKINNAVVVKGHPLLDKDAFDAVLQWQFDPSSLKNLAQPLRVTLDFSLKCP